MTDQSVTKLCISALIAVVLAFTRPIFYHLLRTGGRLYGTSRGARHRPFLLFLSMVTATTIVWMFLILCDAVPATRPTVRIWIVIVMWGSIFACVMGIACLQSWRVKEWLTRCGISLRSFVLVSFTVSFVIAVAVSEADLVARQITCYVVLAYLLGAICVRATHPVIPIATVIDHDRDRLHVRSAQRVIVIVFDELDQRLLLDHRLAGLELPAIDRLMERAVVLSNAVPPSRCTEISLPALLIGRLVFETIPTGPADLSIQLDPDGPHIPFAAQKTVFHDATNRGYRVGCNIGYHPLDRIFPGLFARFDWQEAPETELGIDGGWIRSIFLEMRSVLETPSFSPFQETLYGRHCVTRYKRALESAAMMIQDGEIDLVFLHLPVPHPPFIFDRLTGEIAARNAHKRSYHDNLALADKTLSSLVGVIRASERDRGSVVILTSDHWWRHSDKKDVRVPFGVWFCSNGVSKWEYSKRRNTILLRELIIELLDGHLISPADVLTWFDSHPCDCLPSKT
jgi:hypothetical protein